MEIKRDPQPKDQATYRRSGLNKARIYKTWQDMFWTQKKVTTVNPISSKELINPDRQPLPRAPQEVLKIKLLKNINNNIILPISPKKRDHPDI